jgi:hypothetical protein
MSDLDAEKKYNRLLNLWDPPKDLNSSSWVGFTDLYRKELADILKELFSPGAGAENALPAGYNAISDTKKKIKETFGYDDVPGKPYSAFITDKINTLLIIRESHSSGQDPRPTGLFVSQDTGPNDVVTKPKFIITPGTVLDPASKTKDDTTSFSPITNYGSLPIEYIQRLKLDTVINGAITVTKNADNTSFTVTIPTNIGDISTTLNASFQSSSEAGDGAYFKGNPKKNKFILDNKDKLTETAIRNKVKKYLLVKELGDTLQVQWLNYIFENLAGTDTYNRGNTVIITNDTVVLYRSLINKVPVILTYMGKTRLFKSTAEDEATKAAIDAALIQTIRDEAIRHNLSVIKVIQDIYAKGDGSDAWIGGNIWYDSSLKNYARIYLNKLREKLENMNKDFDIYFNALANPTAAKDFAAKCHFTCPFVWCKGGYYKQVTTVTHLLPGNQLSFPAASFTALSLKKVKLENGTFVNVGSVDAGGGGKQRGGARRTKAQKEQAATAATTSATRRTLITKTIEEWAEPWTEAYTIPARITSQAVSDPSDPEEFEGHATEIEEHDKWAVNVNGVTFAALQARSYFLYWYVREFYPQIFTYAYVFKKAIQKTASESDALIAEANTAYLTSTSALSSAEADRNIRSTPTTRARVRVLTEETNILDRIHQRYVDAKTMAEDALTKYTNVPDSENFLDKYNVEGSFNDDNGFVYELTDDTPAKKTAALQGTLEAISLSEYFVKMFPQLQTQYLMNFFAQMRRTGPNLATTYGVKDFEVEVGEFVPLGEELELNIAQLGGGVKLIHPLAENAMDVYEIYYSLLLQATYEDRSVTDEELEKALAKSYRLQMLEIQKDKKNTSQYDPFALERLLRKSTFLTGPNQVPSSQSFTTPLIYGIGGLQRRKTHKRKRKNGKKTRKGRGKK